MIKTMLSDNPSKRPTIKFMMKTLSKPLDIYAQLAGALTVKRENSMTWRDKFFKLIDKNLYIFNREGDQKAEHIYDLSQWKMKIEGGQEMASILDLDGVEINDKSEIENQIPVQN